MSHPKHLKLEAIAPPPDRGFSGAVQIYDSRVTDYVLRVLRSHICGSLILCPKTVE
jgi:hypothetical protein